MHVFNAAIETEQHFTATSIKIQKTTTIPLLNLEHLLSNYPAPLIFD
jgi:hypothetical protein